MATRAQIAGLRVLVVLVAAAAASYVGCVVYLALTHVGFYLATISMILLHYSGIDSESFAVASRAFEIACEYRPAMYVTGALAFGAAGLLVFGIVRRVEATRWLAMPAVVALVAALVAAGADAYYGITPLSEIEWRERGYNASGEPIEHHLSVEDITCLDDSLSGVTAECEGVFDYQDGCRRFVLHSASEPGRYVKVFVYKGRRTSFSEMRSQDRPRYFEAVQPWFGRRVKVLGQCVNGQIDVELANIRASD